MTRSRKADNARSLPRTITAADVAQGTARLQEVLASIHDMSQEGFPYRDAARTKAELQIRECVRQIFGEQSPEFQTYRHYRLCVANQAEAAQSIETIKQLLQAIQNRQAGIQGLSSLSPSNVQMSMTIPGSPSPSLAPAPTQPTFQSSSPPVSPPPSPASSTQRIARPSPPFPLKLSSTPAAAPQTAPSQPSPLQAESKPKSGPESLQLIRKVCLRFHAVACQLRLRKDSRPTIEIIDDDDVQDLLRALLKMEFDDVGTDEWTPPYVESKPATALFLTGAGVTVIAKKTRAGLTPKDIAEQIAADTAFYTSRHPFGTLFCFVYDPEGRIGSPRQLETNSTDIGKGYTVEVLVAPK